MTQLLGGMAARALLQLSHGRCCCTMLASWLPGQGCKHTRQLSFRHSSTFQASLPCLVTLTHCSAAM